jgi:hypothetical protein
MFILAEVAFEEQVMTTLTRPAVLSTLDGVTTALVAFVLVGLVMPQVIKKPRQFYAIVAVVIGIILLHALNVMVQRAGFTVFAGVITGLLQALGIGLAVMCTGGLAARELAGELARSYEVMRRGSEEKEVIIPIEGQVPRKKPQEEPEHVIYTIDTPPGPAQPPGAGQPPGADQPPGPAKPGGPASIPLE